MMHHWINFGLLAQGDLRSAVSAGSETLAEQFERVPDYDRGDDFASHRFVQRTETGG
jgi:hypothetical protein